MSEVLSFKQLAKAELTQRMGPPSVIMFNSIYTYNFSDIAVHFFLDKYHEVYAIEYYNAVPIPYDDDIDILSKFGVIPTEDMSLRKEDNFSYYQEVSPGVFKVEVSQLANKSELKAFFKPTAHFHLNYIAKIRTQ